MINSIGLSYFDREDYAPALDAFRAAAEYDPADAVIVENAVKCLSNLHRPTEALAYQLVAPAIAAVNFSLAASSADRALEEVSMISTRGR